MGPPTHRDRACDEWGTADLASRELSSAFEVVPWHKIKRFSLTHFRLWTLPLAFLPVPVGNAGDGDEGVARPDVVAHPLHAADGVQFLGLDVRAFGIDVAIFNEDV